MGARLRGTTCRRPAAPRSSRRARFGYGRITRCTSSDVQHKRPAATSSLTSATAEFVLARICSSRQKAPASRTMTWSCVPSKGTDMPVLRYPIGSLEVQGHVAQDFVHHVDADLWSTSRHGDAIAHLRKKIGGLDSDVLPLQCLIQVCVWRLRHGRDHGSMREEHIPPRPAKSENPRREMR